MIEELEATEGYAILCGQITEKLNEVVRQSNNTERAIETMAAWLVQAQTGFNAKDFEGVLRILRGEEPS
jgi:hypothetical protein